jgi:hypothetical protein
MGVKRGHVWQWSLPVPDLSCGQGSRQLQKPGGAVRAPNSESQATPQPCPLCVCVGCASKAAVPRSRGGSYLESQNFPAVAGPPQLLCHPGDHEATCRHAHRPHAAVHRATSGTFSLPGGTFSLSFSPNFSPLPPETKLPNRSIWSALCSSRLVSSLAPLCFFFF